MYNNGRKAVSKINRGSERMSTRQGLELEDCGYFGVWSGEYVKGLKRRPGWCRVGNSAPGLKKRLCTFSFLHTM